MVRGALGKIYKDGEVIIHQGSTGDSMYVIQGGRVEVVQISDSGEEQHLAFLERGDFFGEMAVFEKETRSATVRASGEARVLRIDTKTLLTRISDDPMLAINLLKNKTHLVRQLNMEVAHKRQTSI